MRYLYILIFFLLYTFLAYGQGQYYITDSIICIGAKMIDDVDLMNSQFCQVKEKGQIIRYSPYEVNEYGFSKKQVYVSKTINEGDSSRKVFLRRLYEGDITLYYYVTKNRKTFFVQKDSNVLVEIPKRNIANENYSVQLQDLTNVCPNISDACKLVSYNKESFTKLFSRYEQCKKKPFPHFKYGFLFGFDYYKLIPSGEQNINLGYFDFNYDSSFTFGLFIDNPILVSDFSLHTELFLTKHGYSYNKIVNVKDLDFVANMTSLSVPLLIRYSYPSNKIRPYVNTGLVGSYFVKNDALLYETYISDNTIVINDTQSIPVGSDFRLGYSFGGGIEFNLNYKKSIFIELRYNKQFNSLNPETFGSSAFNLFTGINF